MWGRFSFLEALTQVAQPRNQVETKRKRVFQGEKNNPIFFNTISNLER